MLDLEAEVVLPVPEVRRVMVYFTHRLQSGACTSPRMWQLLQHRLEHLHHHEGHFSAESLLALAWQLHCPPTRPANCTAGPPTTYPPTARPRGDPPAV